MTITTEVRKSGAYVSDGIQTIFPFFFRIFEESDIVVTVGNDNRLDPQNVTLKLDEDYTVQFVEDSENGSITLAEPVEKGKILVITSDVPELQLMHLTNKGAMFPEVLEDAHDKAVVLIQQLNEKLSRAVLVPLTVNESPEDYLIEYENRMVEHVNHVDSVKQEIDEDLKESNEFLRYTQEYLVLSRKKVDEIVADVREDANAISKDVNNKATEFTSLYDGFRQDLERIMQAVQNLPQYNQLNHAFFGFRISDDMQLIVERSEGGDTFNSGDYLYSTVLPITARFEMQGGALFLILPFADDVVEEPEEEPNETPDDNTGETPEGDDSGSDGDDGGGSEDGGDGNEGSGGDESSGDEEDNGDSGGSGGNDSDLELSSL